MTLDQIGLKHGTDQAGSTHDYLTRLAPFFEPMRDSPINLLEIGIAGGHSLRTWLEYFPIARILGLDHNPESIKNFTCEDPARIGLFHGDASDPVIWQTLAEMHPAMFDIVIDDASHYVAATMNALTYGWPLLAPGGLWIIEDTHAGYLPDYRRGSRPLHLSEDSSVMDAIGFMMPERIDDYGRGQCGKPNTSREALTNAWQSVTFSKSLIIIKKP